MSISKVKFVNVLAEIKTCFFWGHAADYRIRKCEYPNLCFLAELIIAISGSNSSVERAFSLLTRMLSDQRLSTSHATINMRLSIKINDALWSKDEKEMLIERALQIYHEKRRILSLEEREPATEPPPTEKSENSGRHRRRRNRQRVCRR